MADPIDPAKLDLYKMAYQVAADRYDNIYKSVWTIFSYMTAVSAAILSFGGSHFYGELLVFVAAMPLVFWYLTTYLPLNGYGDDTLANLNALEDRMKSEFGVVVDHFSDFENKRTKRRFRARYPIHCFMVVTVLGAILALGLVVAKAARGERLIKSSDSITSIRFVP